MLLLQVLFTGAGPKTTALTPVVIAHAVAVAALPANAGMQVTAFVILIAMNMLHQYLLARQFQDKEYHQPPLFR